MKLNLLILALFAGIQGRAASEGSEFAVGRQYYMEGEFKKAAAHFQLALNTNPNDAEACYWMGMSYQVLASIAVPFDGKYNVKARVYLTKAMELAPSRLDYRRQLFDFLLDPTTSSRAGLRRAADILLTVSESDPDYDYMRERFSRDGRGGSSMATRLGTLFLAAPRAAYCLADLPASAIAKVQSPQFTGQ
jgi:tetratricopeptide (TPR) repeat protein